jgi:hypothetical protein
MSLQAIALYFASASGMGKGFPGDRLMSGRFEK